MPTPKKILVVDDEAGLTKSIQAFLERAGYNVHVANTGFEALREIKEFYFDMILLDLNLPEIDGIHLAKITKEDRPETKIVIVTGRMDDYEDELKTIKVDEIIQKPVMMNELTERVKKILGVTPLIPKPLATSGTPKAKLLYIDRDDIVYSNLFSPYIKMKNGAKESEYELAFADDRNKASTLAHIYLPQIALITTEMVMANLGILSEIQTAEQMPREIIVHGKELYAKSPDELGFDRNKVTAIEGGFYNLDYPKRLEEAIRAICLRYGLITSRTSL